MIIPIVLAILLLIFVSSNRYRKDGEYYPPNMMAVAMMLFLIGWLSYSIGYNDGQKDASEGVHKTSPSKMYWMNKEVIQENEIHAKWITISSVK
jgi:hypothetical protein